MVEQYYKRILFFFCIICREAKFIDEGHFLSEPLIFVISGFR